VGRQAPEDERERVAEHQEWRRGHRQEQVLAHVGREALGREVVEGREERRRDRREAEHVEREPPAR